VKETAMGFHVFQCQQDQDYFIVTDAEHADQVAKSDLCPSTGDTLKKIGVFEEMGKERAAFDEGLAKRTIAEHGYFRFEAKSFDPVAERPMSMP
jgi:hypothetical protein